MPSGNRLDVGAGGDWLGQPGPLGRLLCLKFVSEVSWGRGLPACLPPLPSEIHKSCCKWLHFHLCKKRSLAPTVRLCKGTGGNVSPACVQPRGAVGFDPFPSTFRIGQWLLSTDALSASGLDESLYVEHPPFLL